MATVKFRQLIDMAIGSPEPGHVNFYALHCLLNCLAEKLNILDDTIDCSKYETMILCNASAKASNQEFDKLFGCGTRVGGGGCDPEDITDSELYQNPLESEAVPKKHHSAGELETSEVRNENYIENEKVRPQEAAEDLGHIQKITADIVSPAVSVRSRKSADSFGNDCKLEMGLQKLAALDDFFTGITIMKDQLEMTMDHLFLLTYLTLSKKPDSQRVHQLQSLTQTLRAIRKENINIKGSNRFDLSNIQSMDWRLSELQLGEEISEEDSLEAKFSRAEQNDANVPTSRPSQFEPEGCFCYSPGKILDQLMELKGNFCVLTNKVNELSARLVRQERLQTLTLIHDLQEQMCEIKLNITKMKDQQEIDDVRFTTSSRNIDIISRSLEELIVGKVDKVEMEIVLADKVDYNQLQRKVSIDQMQEVQCRSEKRFCEVFKLISETEKNLKMSIDSLRETLGFNAIEGILDSFRQQIETEIQSLRDLMQKYVYSTNDDCSAAGARVKVLEDMACLSCDTTCVMRTVEKAKVAKLPNAHASPSLSPLVNELGYIRKSGFTFGRQAGGSHTKSSAREHFEKVVLQIGK